MSKSSSVIVGSMVCLAIGLMALCFSSSWALPPQYEPGQVIVKFAPDVGKLDIKRHDGIISVGLPSLDRRLSKYRARHLFPLFPHKCSELGHIYQLEFETEDDAQVVAADFATDDYILYAVVREIEKLCDQPNDPSFLNGEQWYLSTVHAPQAWGVTRGDSSVIIAIVDSGVDFDHPDLWGNIWFNPGEDLDGNGIITWWDWNNKDDDGNGYIDDFFGWDFGGSSGGDNDPNEHAPVHGTHCAGIAAAVTDNGLGVAGMSWNCRIMPVKANRDGENNIRWGYQGILYAADNGADIISLSWGNTTTSAFEQEMIDSAFARGAIVVAAAGNDPGVLPPEACQIHYPAGNEHVTAVAATDINDKVTSWSYYGPWVDVAAPGAAIYNTWWDNTYQTLQGTSMSCPLVAGIAALLKVLDPAMDSDQFETKMRNTGDTIDILNPTYVGLLGGGRVNAHAALQSLTLPRLVLEREFLIDDAEGNGDGRPDEGETVNWIVTFSNMPTWQLAEDVWATVTSDDETIVFLQDSTGFGDIQAGGDGDNATAPFRFSVLPNTKAHWSTFRVQAEANSGAYGITDSLEMMIGRPPLLVVDDDGGDDVEQIYQRDLEHLSVVYDRWDVASDGKIGAEDLAPYAVVIWLTGAQKESTLTTEDQDHLGVFLDRGGHLFLTGENIGDEIGSGSFFSDYLLVSHQSDSVWNLPPVVEGVSGDIITDGVKMFLWGSNGPIASPSGSQALPGAVDILSYQNDPLAQTAATRYESPQGYRVVYFGFGYENIRTATGYTSGWVILESILNWFGLETSVQHVHPNPRENKPQDYQLHQNYPNPFNAETSIRYQVSPRMGSQLMTLRVYNLLGQEVRTLIEERLGPGIYEVTWDGRDDSGIPVSSAIYFYRLTSGRFSQTRKMVLLR